MTLYTYLQVKKFLLMLFSVFKTEVADPNIAHRQGSSFPPLKSKLMKESKVFE